MTQRAEQDRHAGEPRLPAACAVIIAGALYAALPDDLLFAPRFVVPALELLLFIPLVAVNPRRMLRENRALRSVIEIRHRAVAAKSPSSAPDLGACQAVRHRRGRGRAAKYSASAECTSGPRNASAQGIDGGDERGGG
jgi:hypothetical protein